MWPKVWRRIPKKKKKTPRCINSYCLLSLYKLCSCSNGFLANSEWCGASAVPNWPCDYLKEASLTLSIPVWYKDRKWCQGEFGLSVCHIESGTTHKYSMNSRVHADFFFFCRLLGRLVNASSCVVPRSATPYTLCLCGHVLLSQAFLLCLQEGKELMDRSPYPPLHLMAFSSSSFLLTLSLDTHLYPSHCLRSNSEQAYHKPESWCYMTFGWDGSCARWTQTGCVYVSNTFPLWARRFPRYTGWGQGDGGEVNGQWKASP